LFLGLIAYRAPYHLGAGTAYKKEAVRCNDRLEVVSGPQIAFKGKAQADEKAEHTWV
jgi:hypothetical protein